MLQIETTERTIDEIDWNILLELQMDARLSYAELGRRVGLSAPAVMERIHKLEDAGVIRGYRVDIDLEKIGLPIMAFIRVGNAGLREAMMQKIAEDMPEVLEAHHITGNDCFIVKIVASSIRHLEQVIGHFAEYNATTTSIVLSSPIQKRLIKPDMVG